MNVGSFDYMKAWFVSPYSIIFSLPKAMLDEVPDDDEESKYDFEIEYDSFELVINGEKIVNKNTVTNRERVVVIY